MKKLYFTLLTIASLATANAQFSITSSNIPAPGENFNYYDVVPSSVSGVGAAGTGQTYDFSGVTLGTIMGVKNYVTPASTASASTFTSSTVSEKDSTNYSYYTGSSSSYQLDGFTFDQDFGFGPVTATVTLSDAGVLFNSFPFSYNSTNGTDTLAGSVLSGFGNGTVTGDVTTSVDGSGSIIILTDTFPNIIRLKTVTNVTATFSFTTLTLIETRYQFYSSLDKFPLLDYAVRDISGTGDTSIVVNSVALVGIKENKQPSFDLFPNPTRNELTIAFVENAGDNTSVEVLNQLGQIVLTETAANVFSKKIDISGLRTGYYIVRVKSGNAIHSEKLLIQ